MESFEHNMHKKTKKPSHSDQQEEDKLSTSEDSGFNIGRPLTNLELIKKAEHYTDTLKLEKAVALYDEGLRRFPNDTLLIDAYTDLLSQLGEDVKAKQVTALRDAAVHRAVHSAEPPQGGPQVPEPRRDAHRQGRRPDVPQGHRGPPEGRRRLPGRRPARRAAPGQEADGKRLRLGR